ncbi:alpha/beta fold hydrolase [Lichenihabitans sp. Uapishka_5]|uniref:RBBP9/YdeN family alpha/beta hydrolase n=1 Tax=Lichenihabitans sp. Uapishka_5 TaxID=3037302 RepID=UPI0029E7DAA9|nr:alpha/beta fold hydrolase [Lichenihabitans sp. Uapishka_5]MDX7949680.1 alpha/beta fold hydrolase [Lichenihabitans sp. Uapishka_5]
MKSRDADILIVPGLGGSGPEHWQTRWEAKLSAARRVVQADWDHPDRDVWVAQILLAIDAAEKPVVLVAHSLGVVAAVFALRTAAPRRVAGAFLVAPPEEARVAGIPEVSANFRPYPREPLPCTAMLVASSDDPYCSLPAAAAMAEAWGATLLDAGAARHINSESGHGPWPEGLMSFAGFLSKL